MVPELLLIKVPWTILRLLFPDTLGLQLLNMLVLDSLLNLACCLELERLLPREALDFAAPPRCIEDPSIQRPNQILLYLCILSILVSLASRNSRKALAIEPYMLLR